MHFWIDKRSNYGIGHNRSMAGFAYQHRRVRAKSIVTPIRQHPPPIPSTSHQHAKTHHPHHHRNRHAEYEQRPRLHQSTSENTQSTSNPLNQHHIPVIHDVYPRDELVINHVVDNTDVENRIPINWLPVYIKIGFQALFLIFIIVSIGLSAGPAGIVGVFFFGIACTMFFIFITRLSIKRLKARHFYTQRVQNETFTEPITEPMINNQLMVQSVSCETIEPPPPYALAIKLPEKQSTYKSRESPPPSYEKISIV